MITQEITDRTIPTRGQTAPIYPAARPRRLRLSPQIRAMVCERLLWLGVELDAEANNCNAAVISAPSSRVAVRVIPTDEEAIIAAHALETIGAKQQNGGRKFS